MIYTRVKSSITIVKRVSTIRVLIRHPNGKEHKYLIKHLKADNPTEIEDALKKLEINKLNKGIDTGR